MKIALGGRFHPKNPLAKLGNIQVDGQDPLFTPHGFHADGQSGLQPLAQPATSIPQKQVFRRLLRQR